MQKNMAHERLKRNIDYIRVLAKSKPKQRKAIINTADKDLIICLCECILNLLSGNIEVDSDTLNKLNSHKRNLRTLADRKTAFKQRKDILEQKGGFLPVLLAPMLGIAGQLIADAITKK
jgi:hypothetical protein